MSFKLEQALELIRQDSPEAVEQGLALLQNTVYSFSMKVCGHPEDAEDTMQGVMIKLLPYLRKFENPQALSVWLYKVARNRCLMNRRSDKNSRSKHVSLDELLPTHYELQELLQSKDPNPETNLFRSESDRRTRQAVLRVPPIYRLVLVLHDMEGLSTSEVACVTGLGEGRTVRVRLHRARLLLRRKLWLLYHARPVMVGDIHAVADDEPPRRPRHCREMFASLSDYIDDLAADAQSREMEKHLDDGEPCVAFLDSLKSAVDQCRTYEPTVTPPGPRNCAKTLTRNTRQRLPRCRRIAASPRTGIHTDLHEWRPFSYSS